MRRNREAVQSAGSLANRICRAASSLAADRPFRGWADRQREPPWHRVARIVIRQLPATCRRLSDRHPSPSESGRSSSVRPAVVSRWIETCRCPHPGADRGSTGPGAGLSGRPDPGLRHPPSGGRSGLAPGSGHLSAISRGAEQGSGAVSASGGARAWHGLPRREPERSARPVPAATGLPIAVVSLMMSGRNTQPARPCLGSRRRVPPFRGPFLRGRQPGSLRAVRHDPSPDKGGVRFRDLAGDPSGTWVPSASHRTVSCHRARALPGQKDATPTIRGRAGDRRILPPVGAVRVAPDRRSGPARQGGRIRFRSSGDDPRHGRAGSGSKAWLRAILIRPFAAPWREPGLSSRPGLLPVHDEGACAPPSAVPSCRCRSAAAGLLRDRHQDFRPVPFPIVTLVARDPPKERFEV